MALAHQEGVDVPIIPYTPREGARFVYRRRVHFRNLISRPVTIALKTADPEVARARSAQLSVRFATVTTRLKAMYQRGGQFMSGEQILAIYQSELREALEVALTAIYRTPDVKDALWQTSLLAEAYGVARRLDRPGELTPEDVARLTERGFRPGEIEFIKCDLDLVCADHAIPDHLVVERLEAAGLEAGDEAMRVARPHILRARADAYRRALHILDADVQNAPNPVEALLDPRFDRAATLPVRPDPTPTGAMPSASPVALSSSPSPIPQATGVADNCPFVTHDARRFSTVIDEVIDDLRREGTWKGDCAQQRRILSTFAWITGDKPLGDYNHLDVDRFKRGLRRLPTTFRFGTFKKGAMATAFDAEVLPPVSKGEERNNKTINRDLSTMSTVARHLAKTVWAPKIPNAVVLDFAGATIAIKADGIDTRPPWTRAHLEQLFSSPLYMGGGSARHRLKEVDRPRVWHDAAYFAPLLWYYHQACREEICGLRADEVDIDHPIPHFKIKDNDVRGRDGELAGEKRIARRRALPLHPELLRLGFADYVRAVRREGHAALFPELYLNEAKRGGAQFYNVTWRYMVDWIEERIPLPRNVYGKGPDIHSIRALGSSFYERDGVSEIIRADVMGHARTGTNAKHYSKRMAAEGLETVLGERLEFICRYVPIITGHLSAHPIRLLPVEERSRVGSGRHRKLRRDAGQARQERAPARRTQNPAPVTDTRPECDR